MSACRGPRGGLRFRTQKAHPLVASRRAAARLGDRRRRPAVFRPNPRAARLSFLPTCTPLAPDHHLPADGPALPCPAPAMGSPSPSWLPAWIGWPGPGAFLEGQTPPLPQLAFLPPDARRPALEPASPFHPQPLLFGSGASSSADALCANPEGWGPLSPSRPFDFTPCFELSVLGLVPALVMIPFGTLLSLVLPFSLPFSLFFSPFCSPAIIDQPGLTFWLSTALYRYHTLRHLYARARSTLSVHVLRAKDTIVLSLAALEMALIASRLWHTTPSIGSRWTTVEAWTPMVQLLAYGVAGVYQRINHTRTRRSSTILLFYWLSQVLSAPILLHTLLTPPSPPAREQWAALVYFSSRQLLILAVFAFECWGVEIGELTPSQKQEAAYLDRLTRWNNVARFNGRPTVSPDQHDDRRLSGISDSSDLSASSTFAATQTLGQEDGTSKARESPYSTANVFSRLTFYWIQPMMTLGRRQFLTEDNMWSLPSNEDAESLGKKFEYFWKRKRTHDGKPRFWATLAFAYGGPYLFAALLKAGQDALAFTSPQVLRRLLQFIAQMDHGDEEQRPVSYGIWLCIALFIVASTQTLFLHQYFQLAFVTGMRVRSGLIDVVYKKSLRLSSEARNKRATGDIVNVMSVDVTRLADLAAYGHIIWSAVFQMLLAFVSLYGLLGWSAFVGVAIMVISVPLNTFLARTMKRLSSEQMTVKDRRTRLMTEILQNIKTIKLFAWESAFSKKLDAVRNGEELPLLKKTGIFSAGFNSLWVAVPFCVSLASFATYSATSPVPLTADVIFPALSLFSLLQFPIAMLANVLTSIIASQVSAARLSDFLDADELDPHARQLILPSDAPEYLGDGGHNGGADLLVPGDVESDVAVSIKHGEFKWGSDQKTPTLEDINLTVRKNELLAVLGRVGDGKTSLLNSILGEMIRSDGNVTVRGTTAYFVQGGWAMGATVRDNITFGLEYDEKFYRQVLYACALEPDLKILPMGDMTEIGERGVSLSGGQRARVALARACYARADIYLLDDPLAAVDAHVGRHIFDHVIGPNGMLKNRARILTLNSVAVLPQCDQIISMRKGIIMPERGSYQEVMAHQGELFQLITVIGKQSTSGDSDSDGDDNSSATLNNASTPDGKGARTPVPDTLPRPVQLSHKRVREETLRQLRETSSPKELRVTGSVSWDVYRQYAQSANYAGFGLYLAAQMLTQVFQVGRDVVLKFYSEKNEAAGPGGAGPEVARHYMRIYGAVGLGGAVVMSIGPLILWIWLAVSSARHFHDGLWNSIQRAPLQWFEAVPTGRLLNLFSRDINTIDEVLPRMINSSVRTVITVAGVICVVVYSVPPFILAIIPLAVIYQMILRYYLSTSRELKRLDSITKSPIFQHFSEALGGLGTIRAFGQIAHFVDSADARVDRNQECYLPSVTCNRWLAVRIEMLGSTVILLSSTLAVAIKANGGRMNAGLLGMMLSQALNTTQALNWTIRSCSDVEQNIVSVERVISYSSVPSEKAYVIPDEPPQSWPSTGKIELKHYSARYREDLPLVLNDLNLTIEAGERIGVVGRTGAGKSSLMLALFRIIEPTSGTIAIDGVDTQSIGLRDLRRAISIIPQDSNIWESTLRDNLDPTYSADDDALWKALASAHLKDFVQRQPGGLDAEVAEGGSNLSAGQRQLLCIARALLRRAKICVLDEATASIDLETDELLQNILRHEFPGTVVTVAHRLNTIIDSTRVLVLDKGQVAEFDTPANLLANKQSIFFSMARDAGLAQDDA